MSKLAEKISSYTPISSKIKSKVSSGKSRLSGWYREHVPEGQEFKVVSYMKMGWPIILTIIGFIISYLVAPMLLNDFISYLFADLIFALILVVLSRKIDNGFVKGLAIFGLLLTFVGAGFSMVNLTFGLRLLSMAFNSVLWGFILYMIFKYSAEKPLVNFGIIAPYFIPIMINSILPQLAPVLPYFVIVLSFAFYLWLFGPFDGIKYSSISTMIALFYLFIWVPIISINPFFQQFSRGVGASLTLNLPDIIGGIGNAFNRALAPITNYEAWSVAQQSSWRQAGSFETGAAPNIAFQITDLQAIPSQITYVAPRTTAIVEVMNSGDSDIDKLNIQFNISITGEDNVEDVVSFNCGSGWETKVENGAAMAKTYVTNLKKNVKVRKTCDRILFKTPYEFGMKNCVGFCPGDQFKIKAIAWTTYYSSALLPIEIIDDDYLTNLLLQGRMNFYKPVATMSYGPMAIGMTIGQQPLSDDTREISLILAFQNEGEGELKEVSSMLIAVPSDIISKEDPGSDFVCYDKINQLSNEIREEYSRTLQDFEFLSNNGYTICVGEDFGELNMATLKLNIPDIDVLRKTYLIRADLRYSYEMTKSITGGLVGEI